MYTTLFLIKLIYFLEKEEKIAYTLLVFQGEGQFDSQFLLSVRHHLPFVYPCYGINMEQW